MTYLLLPASLQEKFVHEILTRIILFIILAPLLFWAVANLEGAIIHQYNSRLINYKFSFRQAFLEIDNKNDSDYWFAHYLGIPLSLLVFIASFTGSCYFTKSPVLKNLFTVALVILGFSAFQYALFKMLDIKNYDPPDRILFIGNRKQLFIFLAWAISLIDLTLLAIAWFRFKEKEA